MCDQKSEVCGAPFYRRPKATAEPTSLNLARPPSAVTELLQRHYLSGMEDKDPALYRSVVETQFNIARYLSDHPRAIVVNENQFTDLIPETRAGLGMTAVAKTAIFPGGLPKRVSDLNELQGQFLAQTGGAPTAYYLGLVSHVYGEAAYEDAAPNAAKIVPYVKKFGSGEKFSEAVDAMPELHKLYIENRESNTMKRVAALAKDETLAGRPIVVVYGSAHHLAETFHSDQRFTITEVDLTTAVK